MKEIYIALDLETTGFDPADDQVLEIAAIKFQGNKILETFETLINPGLEIPAMVSYITGISNETVKDAPSFADVAENLSLFLGNYPIVGHNIEFDLTFLEAKGIPITAPQLDTLKLASILLPEMPSYSLDTLSRLLKIKHEQKHRAFSDARVCQELFLLLRHKIDQIKPAQLQQIQELIPRCRWDLGEIFMLAKPAREKGKKHLSSPPARPDRIIPAESLNNIADFIDLLGPESALSPLLPNYEFRGGQQRLLQKILDAISNKYHLIAESGTGTGKTMAYLLAAAYARQFLGKKIIISTYTNNLQDQIVKKDFPLIQKIFPDLTIAVLKGRKKYLDLDRLRQLQNRPRLEEHELTSLIKIIIWLDQTRTGDLDELNLQNKETQIYEEICADPEFVPSLKKESDFLEKARRKAESADIVVVNHALLIQDHLTEKQILPNADLLMVDEAHHLEKTLTDGLTVLCSYNRLDRLWTKIVQGIDKLATSRVGHGTGALMEKTHELSAASLNIAEKIFLRARRIIEKRANTMTGQPSQIAISPSLRESEEWLEMAGFIDELCRLTGDLEKLTGQLIDFLLSQETTESELPGAARDLLTFHRHLCSVHEHPENKILWINKGYDESVHLCFAPLSVKEIFSTKIFPGYDSILLTSATLSTNGNFAYIRSELGLDENFEEIKIPSHFSYPDQVRIILPEDLPDPKEPEYLPACAGIIDSVIKKNGGRTLVLFTAKKDLARVFHDLAPGLKTGGINLLAQNLSGGRGKIISHFQDEPESCAILGTNSFWEGVDLIGPILTCVIIQKLPFDPPDDPIIRARSSLLHNPFEEYSLPRAILRFKQGFGRLIRSARDTGSVIILDSRLVRKSYGREFIGSLPENIKIQQCSQNEVADYL